MKILSNVLLTILLFIMATNPVYSDRYSPISMDFKGADLRDVFRVLAQIAEVNVVVHQTVQGEITLSLNNVPFDEAIQLLTMSADLDYIWIDNSLFIAGSGEIEENFSKEECMTLNIKYGQIDSVKEILKEMFDNLKVIEDPRTNTLVISGKREDLEKVQELIKDIDIPIPQVYLEVKVVEISTSGLEKIGSASEKASRLKLLTDDTGLVVDVALELPQFVEYLTKKGLAKTLARPALVTLDGKTSRLLIGDKVPIEIEEEAEGKITKEIKYIEVGIKLEFTPRISSDGYITLNIKPQISSFGEYLEQGYPLIKSREVETFVRIRDGETFVIGGLIREEDRKSLEKVPFLGDLPLIGTIFKHDEDSKQSSEIIIFITPKIIFPHEKQEVFFERNVPDQELKDQKESAIDDLKKGSEENTVKEEVKGSNSYEFNLKKIVF